MGLGLLTNAAPDLNETGPNIGGIVWGKAVLSLHWQSSVDYLQGGSFDGLIKGCSINMMGQKTTNQNISHLL